MRQDVLKPSSKETLLSLIVAFSIFLITTLLVQPPGYNDYTDLVINFLYMAPGPLVASLVLAKVYKKNAVNRGITIGLIVYFLSPFVLPGSETVWVLEAARLGGAGVGGAVGARVMELYGAKGHSENAVR
ncbi:hypothetical protein A3K69_08470 [Candidatus Bathyarchaeota archaeon RBG_16_57_9]|nr:MAG: hypothetical protein A3K69_08470 [Candidatus Bathyarchaeota archaeon RBG_16_57_9]